jgi:hypothetical protein
MEIRCSTCLACFSVAEESILNVFRYVQTQGHTHQLYTIHMRVDNGLAGCSLITTGSNCCLESNVPIACSNYFLRTNATAGKQRVAGSQEGQVGASSLTRDLTPTTNGESSDG